MKKNLAPTSLLLVTAVLAACVDSKVNSTAKTSIAGTAAVGAPISGGTVDLRCGNGFTAGTITGTDGKWSTSVPSNDLPCNVKVSGGTPAGTFYSVAQKPSGTATTSTANVTPLTDLATAAALNSVDGSQALEAWFANDSPELRQQVADGIAAASAQLRMALSDAGYDLPSEDFDPFTASIVAGGAGDLYDQVLEAYKAALANASKNYDDARDDYVAGSELPPPSTTTPPTGPSLPDDKLGVSFDDPSASHLWLQPAGQGGITAINNAGDGQVIVRMGDGTNDGPDGTVGFNILPNQLGTFACGDTVGNGQLHMQVTFQGITNPRKTYVSYQDAADPAQRTLLSGYSCSVTLTHVGTFASQYVYGDDYIEGTFTAKLRQQSADCAGEGNCSPYKELMVSHGQFRINKSGTYTPTPPPVVTGNTLAARIGAFFAGTQTYSCPEANNQTSTHTSVINADGSSTLDDVPVANAVDKGTVMMEGLKFNAARRESAQSYPSFLAQFDAQGHILTSAVNVLNVNGSGTKSCSGTGGTISPANIDVAPIVASYARTATVNCSITFNQNANADNMPTGATTFTVSSDGGMSLGTLSVSPAQYKEYNTFKFQDNATFAASDNPYAPRRQIITVGYTPSQTLKTTNLSLTVDADGNTVNVEYQYSLGRGSCSVPAS